IRHYLQHFAQRLAFVVDDVGGVWIDAQQYRFVGTENGFKFQRLNDVGAVHDAHTVGTRIDSRVPVSSRCRSISREDAGPLFSKLMLSRRTRGSHWVMAITAAARSCIITSMPVG